MNWKAGVCAVALLAVLLPWYVPSSTRPRDAAATGLVEGARPLALQPVFTEDFSGATVPSLPAGWAQADVTGTSGNWGTTTTITHPV